jgi:hypothetical protein
MARGPVVRWKTNEGEQTTPPADASEWVSIIARVSPILSVELVSREDGRWWVGKANETPPQVGGGPYSEPLTTDRRKEVTEALREACKTIVD